MISHPSQTGPRAMRALATILATVVLFAAYVGIQAAITIHP